MIKILAIGDFHGKFPAKLKKEVKKADLVLCTGDYAGIDEWRPLLKKVFKAREKGEELSIENILGKKKYKELLKKDYAAGKISIRELNKLKIKVFSVFGNGDWYEWMSKKYELNKNYGYLMKKLRYIKDVNRGKGVFKKIKIIGFGGYLDPDIYFTAKGKSAINDLSEEATRKRKKRYNLEKSKFMKLMKDKPDILLSHYNPYKCLDRMKTKGFALTGSHMGVGFFNQGIKKYKPVLVVCGHLHENQDKCKIGKTLVINPGAAKDGKAAIINFDEKKKKINNVKFIR